MTMVTKQGDRLCAEILERLSALTGIVFAEGRRSSAEKVIRSSIKRLRVETPAEFLARIQMDKVLFDEVIDEIVVGETYFFRDPDQFGFIRDVIFPDLIGRRLPGRPINVWSAGCSSGEEPYSLAMLVQDLGIGNDIRIFGTDISAKALRKAGDAVYGAWSFRQTVGDLADRHFIKAGKHSRLVHHVRDLVRFDYLNLASDIYLPPTWDAVSIDLILCRNVLIYFDTGTQRRVAASLFGLIREGGWLVTGASDPPLWEFAPFSPVVTDRGVFYRRLALTSASVKESGSPKFLGSDTLASTSQRANDRRHRFSTSRPKTLKPASTRVQGRSKPLAPDEKGPPNISPLIANARRHADANRLRDAEQAAKESARDYPLSPDPLYLHAIVQLGLGKYEDAAKAVRRLLYVDPTLAIAHMLLGSIMWRMNRPEAARSAYQRAYKLCSEVPPNSAVPLSENENAAELARSAAKLLAVITASTGDIS